MQQPRGLFVSIEGADADARNAQAAQLQSHLDSLGYRAVRFDFPQEDESSGYFVRQYIRGHYGAPSQVGPYTAAMYYSLDRHHMAAAITEAIEDGKIVIASGFTAATMAEQGAKIAHPEERRGFFIWLDNLEFCMLGLPRPDLSLVLRLPNEDLMSSVSSVAPIYEDLCTLFPKDFAAVDTTRSEISLSEEEIHHLVWGKVEPRLPELVQGAVAEPVAKPQTVDQPHAQLEPAKLTALDTLRTMHAPASSPEHISVGQDMSVESALYTPSSLDTNTRTLYLAAMEQLLDNYHRIAARLEAYLHASTAAGLDISSDVHAALAQLLPLATYVSVATESSADGVTTAEQTPANGSMRELATNYLSTHYTADTEGVVLVSAAPRNELDLVPAMLYEYSDQPLEAIARDVSIWPYDKKAAALNAYLGERGKHVAGKALDQAIYTWEAVTDVFTLFTLMRSIPMARYDWQPLSPRLGYETPAIIETAGLADDFDRSFDRSLELSSQLQQAGFANEAQYATLLGHRLRWKATITARQLLRFFASDTDEQTSPNLQSLKQAMLDQLSDTHPILATSLQPLRKQDTGQFTVSQTLHPDLATENSVVPAVLPNQR